MAYKYRLSPTALNLLEDCPRCFWLDTVKGVPRPRGIFPSLPNGVDRILKQHFDRATKKGELPLELSKENVDAELFHDLALLDKWRDARRGIEWTDAESGIYFHGGVDAMLERKGKLIVLDFKTRGYALKPDSAHYYTDQLDCYNWLLRKNGHETEDYSYLLFFIPERVDRDGDFVFDSKLVKIPVNVARVDQMLEHAKQVLAGPLPQSSNECEYCNFFSHRTGTDDKAVTPIEKAHPQDKASDSRPPTSTEAPKSRNKPTGRLDDFA